MSKIYIALKKRCINMKKDNLFLVAMSVICFFPITQETVAATPSQPQPDWKVGDSWAVRTWCAVVTNYGDKKRKNVYIKKGIPVDVSFKVSAIKSTAGFKIPYMPTDLRERAKEKYKNMPEKGYKCFEIEVVFPKEETGFHRIMSYSVWFVVAFQPYHI
jgi:hypothetical protein